MDFNAKVSAGGSQVLGLSGGYDWTQGHRRQFNITYTGRRQFDITASFDGIENDTQMRYAANNDAHFVMNFNSTFNPANQSGLNLVIGSDGLVYNIVPSVTSGAGLPVSDNIDTTFSYQQPQPSYATGNADGLSGNLEPYDRPGKTKEFRAYSFYLQPTQQNADDFWNTVVDPNWLTNSGDPDAIALLSAKKANKSMPWRLFYRVTYSERFLPPISTAAIVVPQITPVFAVPVTRSGERFPVPAAGQRSSLLRTIRTTTWRRTSCWSRPPPRASGSARCPPAAPDRGCPCCPTMSFPSTSRRIRRRWSTGATPPTRSF